MINPHAPTDFARNEGDAQSFLMFCVAVAGKTAEPIAKKLDQYLDIICEKQTEQPCATPFSAIRNYPYWRFIMREVRLGKYTTLEVAFQSMSKMFKDQDVRTATMEQLTSIPGIGMKTANFFLLHSRAGHVGIPLDVHVLRWLRNRFPKVTVPSATPQAPDTYRMLESLFLGECMRLRIKPYVGDITCWKSQGKTIDPGELQDNAT